jgi:glutamate racemase
VPVPVLGVIETGAAAAQARSRSGSVLVLATTATVASHAYQAACKSLGLRAFEKACPLLVPLVEEGWTAHPVTREVLRIYLAEALAESAAAAENSPAPAQEPSEQQVLARDVTLPAPSGARPTPALHEAAVPNQPDTLVLGCTHYPLLRSEIESLAPPNIAVIDSAEVTASFAVQAMDRLGFRALDAHPSRPSIDFYATDGVDRFRALGSLFLGEAIERVTLVDLGG